MIWVLSIMKTKKGMSIIEIIFAVGITVIVITAVISLLVKSIGLKTAVFQRKKATELTEVVIENLLTQKNNDAEGFWTLEGIGLTNLSGFEGYTYQVDFEDAVCSLTTCKNAIITVNWGDKQTLSVNRLFAR